MTDQTNFSGLSQKLPSLAEDAFAVVTIPAKDVAEASVESCRLLAARGFQGVYVSLAKDYLSVSAALKAAGVDASRIAFVDAVSRMYGIAPVETPEVTYVDGPLSVDSLTEGVAAALRGMKDGKRFVVFDSLTTLLLYNSLPATLAFTQTLRDLLKREHAAGIIMVAYVDALNTELIEKLRSGGGEVVQA